MTHDPSRPGSGSQPGSPPIPGESGAVQYQHDSETATDQAIDFEANKLRATGQTCARCGGEIKPAEDARRLLSGDYQHEVCP
jgi:hypothetical protein